MIRIAIPNKGRLADSARELLELAGLEFETRGERALQASLGGDFVALFVRARDIPEFVADGAADMGITGRDLVVESGRAVEVLLDLGFGRCRVVVAARDDSGIASLADVPDEARVATVFPNLTTRFFAAAGRHVTVVPVSGAAEIAPHLGVADIIVDLVSTGSTLKTNGLVEIEKVLDSSALLIAREGLGEQPESARRTRELVAALESVLRAQDKRYLMANVPRAALAEVKRVLPGISGPTIIDVLDGDTFVAAHAVVDRREVYRVIAELKALGAEGILVTRIERLMP
jgi:ATP phosphoribosyltransferase